MSKRSNIVKATLTKTIPKKKKVQPKKKNEEMPRRNIPQYIRKQLWLQYYPESQVKCRGCSINTITPFDFHAGHIISDKNGGDIILKNLLPLCASCNISIGKRNMIVNEDKTVNLDKTFNLKILERKFERKPKSFLSYLFG